MFNVCPACGQYSVEKDIDPRGPYAICPACGHRHAFRRLPLFVLTGASGSGKTTVALRLPSLLPECVTLETDILWCPQFDTPEDGYRTYRDLWLRLAKNIGQNGRPVVLVGSATPEQFEPSPERRYLADIHYLALVCGPAELTRRLQSRPAWRDSASPAFIERMTAFDEWLATKGPAQQPPIESLDTARLTVEQTAQQVAAWVRQRVR